MRGPGSAKAKGCDGRGSSREVGVLHVAGLCCGWGNVVGGVLPREAGSGHMPGSGPSLQVARTHWGASTKEGCVYRLKDNDMIWLQAGDAGVLNQATGNIQRMKFGEGLVTGVNLSSLPGIKFSSARDVYFLHCFSVE